MFFNLTTCKTAQEALEKIAVGYGYADVPVKVIIHNSIVTGLDIPIGDVMVKWRKQKEG